MFITNSRVTDILVEIGLRRTTYVGSEEDEQTEEICAAILAEDDDFANGVAGIFTVLGIVEISATITPTERTGPNAATGK